MSSKNMDTSTNKIDYNFQPVKIKTYKQPLLERLAKCRPAFKFVYAGAISAAIAVPLIMAYSNLWYIYLLLLPVFIWFICAIVNFVRFSTYLAKYQLWCEVEGEDPTNSEVDGGAPGTGKTLYLVNSKYQQAKVSWFRVQEEMWFILPKIKRGQSLTQEEKEVFDAYVFYTQHEGIPCMGGNTPVWSKEYKRYCYKVGISALKQETRMPYRICTILDEFSGICPQELYIDKWKNEKGSLYIEEAGKYSRQWAEWRNGVAEQNPNNIFKGYRNVVGEIKVMNSCRVVLKPLFLTWLYKKLMVHFVGRMSMHDTKFVAAMRFLKNYISFCGFFKISYTTKNTETGSSQVVVLINQKEKQIYIPTAMPIKYVTRLFRNAYRCLLKTLDLDVYDDLVLGREEAMSYLRGENFKIKD